MSEATAAVYDVKGFPIERGDLLRTFHFKDGRRNTWLYHVACIRPDGHLEAVPVRCLATGDRDGTYFLHQSVADLVACEIVQGLNGGVQFYERPKKSSDTPTGPYPLPIP
jgi:hypothetical protein